MNIAALLQAVVDNPASSFSKEKVAIIKNPGQSDIGIVIEGEHNVERFEAKDGGGKAGIACRTVITKINSDDGST